MTSEVLLRDVTEDDLPTLFEFQLDEETARMTAFPSRERESFMQHWARVLGNPANVNQVIVADGRVVGSIVSFEQDGHREVGYSIGREFWGRGYATRGLAAFLERVKTRPLYGYVATHNVASRRVLEKCGFTFSGNEPAYATLDGEDVAGFVFKLDSSAGA